MIVSVISILIINEHVIDVRARIENLCCILVISLCVIIILVIFFKCNKYLSYDWLVWVL